MRHTFNPYLLQDAAERREIKQANLDLCLRDMAEAHDKSNGELYCEVVLAEHAALLGISVTALLLKLKQQDN